MTTLASEPVIVAFRDRAVEVEAQVVVGVPMPQKRTIPLLG